MGIVLTDHAVERYAERVRHGLTADQVQAELAHVLGHLRVTDTVPEWVHSTNYPDPEAVAMLGDGIAFVLKRHGPEWVALTCLARSSFSEPVREAVNHKRRGRQRRRHAHREKWRERKVTRRLEKGRREPWASPQS